MNQHNQFDLPPNPYESLPGPHDQAQHVYAPTPKLKHSGLGIASLVIAVLVALQEVICVVIAAMMESSTPGSMDEDAPENVLLGLAICGGLLVALVGLCLGIAGAVQSNRQKVFAVLGIALNSLIVLGLIGLMAIGMALGGP